MPVSCPQCGRKYDVTRFQSGQSVKCRCGFDLDISLLETFEDFLRFFESEEERKKAKEIQQDAAGICRMILDNSCPDVDIQIAQEKLKKKVVKLFPRKIDTYEMIYESRFKRLWEQFRHRG